MPRNTGSTQQTHTIARNRSLIAATALCLIASTQLTACIAAAAAAGAGAGYAVGHEQGEDHVTEGKHGDDD